MQSTDLKSRRPKTNLLLWILQVLLAVFFFMAGMPKAFQPLGEISETITWVPDVAPPLVRFIGISEILGAVGLLVPALTRLFPVLTTYAGAGLSLVMLAASVFHGTRGEMVPALSTFMVFVIALFITYGRRKLVPIPARKGSSGDTQAFSHS